MKISKFNLRNFIGLWAIVLAFFVVASAKTKTVGDDKIKPEELIAKHLESVGSAEARAANKSLTILGTTKAIFKGRGEGFTEGIVVMASDGEKHMIGMKFNNSDYQYETVGYDGKNLSVGYVVPGQRSVWGEFLRSNENSFEIGILGGVLSNSWEFYNYNEKTGKIKPKGIETIDGKKLYEVEYNPRKGSDLRIKLYFDAENFRHVRTEYTRAISAGLSGGGVDASSRQGTKRFKMVEEFSDFKEENKLTLPHNYKIYFEQIVDNGTVSREWQLDLKQFNFNNPIDSKNFRVDGR